MFARRVSLYLDNGLGAVLLLVGTALALAFVCGWVPIQAGIVGLVVFGYGKLLCIAAMLRGQASREVEAFQLGREAGLRSVR